jgi:ribosomal protein L37E
MADEIIECGRCGSRSFYVIGKKRNNHCSNCDEILNGRLK